MAKEWFVVIMNPETNKWIYLGPIPAAVAHLQAIAISESIRVGVAIPLSDEAMDKFFVATNPQVCEPKFSDEKGYMSLMHHIVTNSIGPLLTSIVKDTEKIYSNANTELKKGEHHERNDSKKERATISSNLLGGNGNTATD